MGVVDLSSTAPDEVPVTSRSEARGRANPHLGYRRGLRTSLVAVS